MQRKGPLRGKIFARCIPERPFCRAFRMHGAHILPKPAHFGCVAAICCHELALFPSEAPSGTHEAKKLPRIAARERTAAISCHCRTLGNAFREHFAIGEPPKTHRGEILPRPAARGCISAKYCHDLPPRGRMASICCHGKAFRGYAAAACQGGIGALPR